jgi:hypothetical protein
MNLEGDSDENIQEAEFTIQETTTGNLFENNKKLFQKQPNQLNSIINTIQAS